METKNAKLVGGENIEMTAIDNRLSNFEKALQDVMHDAMGLVGDCISPLYIKEQAEYLLKQMMKDAVEGEVVTNGFYPYEPRIVASYPNCPYALGDKVRIVVLKAEE